MSSEPIFPLPEKLLRLPEHWELGIVLGAPSVDVSGLSSAMVHYLAVCHRVHLALFQTPLCVVGGSEAQCEEGAKHRLCKAVDVYAGDLDPEGRWVFLACMHLLKRHFSVGSLQAGVVHSGGHYHVEEAG